MKFLRSIFCVGLIVSSAVVFASDAKSVIRTDVPIEELQYESLVGYDYEYELDNECHGIADPLERINRKIFFINGAADYIFLRPFARSYRVLVSDNTRKHVDSFLDTVVTTPVSIVSYGVQGNVDNAFKSFWRVVTNVLFGGFGTVDVATGVGLNPKPQNIGSALAHYGVPSGPYIVLPLYGSTNIRDMWDLLFFNNRMNSVRYVMSDNAKLALSGVYLLHRRASVLPFTDYVSKVSPDPYVTIRSVYHQQRENSLTYPSGYRCGRQVLDLKK